MLFPVLVVLVVAAIFGTLIDVVCAFALPHYLPNPALGTYRLLVLAIGVLMASLVGGYVGYHDPRIEALSVKVRISFPFAVWTAFLTLLLSIFLIVNTIGS